MAESTPSESAGNSPSIVQSRGFLPGLVVGGIFAGLLCALVSATSDDRGVDNVTTDDTVQTFKAIAEIQESLGRLATDIEKDPGRGETDSEIEARVAALGEMNGNLYKLVADLEKNTRQGDTVSALAEMNGNLNNLVADLKKNTSQGDTVTALTQMNGNLDKLVADLEKNTGQGDTAAEHALRADQRAQELRESNSELAGILYLNAFNTNPENVEPLLAYVDLMAGADAPVEQVNQVIAMLDVALYRVAPDAVEHLHERKATLESVALSTDSDADAELAATNLATAVETLMSQEPNLLVGDEGSLEEFIQEAEYVLEQLDLVTTETDSASRVVELSEKLAMLRRCDDALRLAHGAEVFAGRAEAFVQSENTRLATMLLNSAENSAVQAVSMCDPTMPAALIERTSLLMARLDGLSSMISDRQSSVALDKIRELSGQFDALLKPATTFEIRCNIVEKLNRDCQPYVAEITSASARSEAMKYLTFMQVKLTEFRREQYTAYNHWALERCQNAAASIRQEWFKTSENAVKVFGDSEVAKIDPTIISPETGRVYNQVVERLMTEMSPDVVAEHEKQLTLTQKIRLENF